MNNPMNAMLQFINSGGNPRQFVENNLKNNPQFNQAYQQLKGVMANSNMSSKEFALKYFKDRGVDPKQVEMLVSRLGVK